MASTIPEWINRIFFSVAGNVNYLFDPIDLLFSLFKMKLTDIYMLLSIIVLMILGIRTQIKGLQSQGIPHGQCDGKAKCAYRKKQKNPDKVFDKVIPYKNVPKKALQILCFKGYARLFNVFSLSKPHEKDFFGILAVRFEPSR